MTYFVSVSDSRIHSQLKGAQEKLFGIDNGNLTEKESCVLGAEFYPAAVPISKSHITLFLFNADGHEEVDNDDYDTLDKRLGIAIDAIDEAVREYQFWVSNKQELLEPLTIKLEGVGHFSNSVIFAKPKFVEKENFEMLWQTLRKHLIEKKFISENDSKQRISSFEDFSPHVTLLKMSRIYKQNRNKRRRKDDKQVVPRKFPNGCTEDMQEKQFGEQMVDRIELLSLTKEGKKGGFPYYFCQQEFFIAQKPIMQGAECVYDHSHCCTPLVFPYVGEESTERDTEKLSEVGIARRKLIIEKDNARNSVRTSMLSMLRNKLGLKTHNPINNAYQNTDGHLRDHTKISSTKNIIYFVGGSLLTIAAIKILFNRLSR